MLKRAEKVRVLIADDSAFMRKILSDIINSDNQLEVVDTARNGEDAYKKTINLKPDVVTLDVQMPILDGIGTLEKIMAHEPTPVIMLSALTQSGTSATIQALEKGAVDFIPKPSGTISLDITKLKEEIITKIKIAAQVPIERCVKKQDFIVCSNEGFKLSPKAGSFLGQTYHLVAMGTSTGGPKALHQILSQLPSHLNAALLIVQHMPPGFTKSLAQRLDSVSPLNVKEAEDGEEVKRGWAYVAPGDYHLEAVRQGDKIYICLHKKPSVNGHRPSVDVMMVSVAKIPGPKVGVIMTGMGQDGAKGMKALKEAGARTLGESAETCVVYGMPKAAVQLGVVDYEVALQTIPQLIVQATGVKMEV